MMNYWPRKFEIAAVLILTVALEIAISSGAGVISAPSFLAVFAVVSACLVTGRAASNLFSLPLPISARFPTHVLLGMVSISGVMLLACFVLRISAGAAFLIACLTCSALIGLDIWLNKKKLASQELDSDWFVASMSGFVCGVSLLWSWKAIESVPKLGKTGIFNAWIDFFFHGTIIAQFVHFSALKGTSMFEFGANVPLYHWASYMLPAAICAYSHTPALVIATTCWVLLGFIIMALGAWALGSILADWRGAVAAVVMVLLAPSAAHYGFRNPFFDFPWLLQISPGLSYGTGLCLLSISLCILGLRRRHAATLVVAGALALAEAIFKMQLFVLLAPTFTVFVIWFWRWPRSKIRYLGLALFGSLTLSAALVAEFVSRAPHFFTGPHELGALLNELLSMEPSAAPHLFSAIAMHMPLLLAPIAGILLLLLEATGVLIPLYVVIWAYQRGRGISQLEICFPFLLLTVYSLIVAAFPTSNFNGLAEEYQHRSFVLVYAVLSIWCGSFGAILAKHWWPTRCNLIIALMTCCLLPAPLLLRARTQTGNMSWSRNLASTAVPKGLLQSALYIRTTASPGDVVLSLDSRTEGALVCLSERRALLDLGHGYAAGLTYDKEAVASRLVTAERLRNAKTYPEVLQIGRTEGLDWYVATPSEALPREIQNNAGTCSGGYCAVRLGRGEGTTPVLAIRTTTVKGTSFGTVHASGYARAAEFRFWATASTSKDQGVKEIHWSVPGVSQVEIRVVSPSGTLFAVGGPSGESDSGSWATPGFRFFLLDAQSGNGTAENRTLAELLIIR